MKQCRPEFTSAYRRIYPLTTDPEEQAYHAWRLRAGLAALSKGFMAEICTGCDGTGSANWQKGPWEVCPICNGAGLLQGHIEAPPSVLHQVLNAAERESMP